VDFFQGPIADNNDGIDNDRDGCVDCTFLEDSLGNTVSYDDDILGEQIIMSKFVYYNNDNTPLGNPNGFADFYNYLRGIWRDNQPITYGADGRDPSAPVCNFMFPGTTDPDNFSTLGEWSEFSAGNVPADRRFLQSAGTFTLTPGAVNYVTTGVVWAKAQQGGPLASVDLMKLADDKAQALFDNCFKLIDGPNAPDLAIRELDKKFIFSLQNYNTNAVELYSQEDPTIVGVDDSLKTFDFQGYQVFQLKDATVTTADIGNPDKVRLVYQCDIKDGVAQLVNFEFDPNLNANVPIEKVNGADKGISHTFIVNQDLFATGSTALVNHKTYYYTVLSYAYN
ncbi:MAG: T9SS C-terminal target domain-containing protein, partial [Bacteroidota bacterium]